MNIYKEQTGELTATIKVEVTGKDLEPRVKKRLNEIRRTAQLKGFRPGKAPVSLIKRMYGANVKIEELDKFWKDAVNSYIKDEKLDLLVPSLVKEPEYVKPENLTEDEEFKFSVNICVKPDIELTIDKGIEFVRYNVEVSQEDIENRIKEYTDRYHDHEDVEEVSGKGSIKVGIKELDGEGNVLEEGASTDNMTVFMHNLKDEETKQALIGLKVGDKKVFKLNSVLALESEVKHVLHKMEITDDKSEDEFEFTIQSVSVPVPAKLDEELFSKIFGDGVKTEEEFRERVKLRLEEEYKSRSESLIYSEIEQYLKEKAGNPLPEDFMREWLQDNMEDNMAEKSGEVDVNSEEFQNKVDKSLPDFMKNLMWQLIVRKLAAKYELKAENHEIEDMARYFVASYFMNSGFPVDVLNQDTLNEYAQKLVLNKPEEVARLEQDILEKKSFDKIIEDVTIKEEQINFKQLEELEKNRFE